MKYGLKQLRKDFPNDKACDAFWSHIKRSVSGTHKVVSKKHLQEYLDAFVFHRNNAGNDRQRFFVLLENVLRFGATV